MWTTILSSFCCMPKVEDRIREDDERVHFRVPCMHFLPIKWIFKKKLSGLASSAHETNNKTQWVNLRRASNINQVIQVFPLPFNFLHEIWCRPGAPRSFRRKRRSGSALSILHLGWAWISYLFWETCVQILGSSMYVAGSEAPGMPSAISRKRRGKMPSPGNQNVLDGL